MTGMHRGTIVVDRDGDVDGMVGGDVIVRSGVRAHVSGMVRGDVVIGDGAEVHVVGMVSGRIIGSPASVTGMVRGC